MRRTIAISALVLAAGGFGLQWLKFNLLTGALPFELYVLLIVTVFTAGGLWVGWRMAARRRGPIFARNDRALQATGITRQELRVLEALATGRSNKEIARQMGLSPNTVKTHLAGLYAKLEVRRRTEAIDRGRTLDLIP
jgi:NarL family two-component system response regulator LiaR